MIKRFCFLLIILALSLVEASLSQQEYAFAVDSAFSIQGPFTIATGDIDYLNRGMSGWSLKPGSISIRLTSANGAVGLWTDDGNGELSGSFSQVPGGTVYSASGVINYDTGAWGLFLSVPFLGQAEVGYLYVVREGGSSVNRYVDYPYIDQELPTVPGVFTSAAGEIVYRNRGIVGWSLKPGSISIVLETDTMSQGVLSDDELGSLAGEFVQVAGGMLYSATGTVDYIAGTWSVDLSEWFIGPAQISCSYIVRRKIPPVVYNNFDNTGRAHCTIYDRSSGRWYSRSVSGNVVLWETSFGGFSSGGVPVTGDYDGDGKSDLTIYDPVHGVWFARGVAGHAILSGTEWGYAGAVAVPGDYDDDGISDLAVYDATRGKWYIRDVGGNVILWGANWGFPGMVAVPGDYDGDGSSDLAVYDVSSGKWYVRDVAGNTILWCTDWGYAGAVAVPGDYDGDGVYDLAVYDASRGKWYVRDVAGNIILWDADWGFSEMVAVPGDYDGDGMFDLAGYDASSGNWYVRDVAGKVILWGLNWGGFNGAHPVGANL